MPRDRTRSFPISTTVRAIWTPQPRGPPPPEAIPIRIPIHKIKPRYRRHLHPIMRWQVMLRDDPKPPLFLEYPSPIQIKVPLSAGHQTVHRLRRSSRMDIIPRHSVSIPFAPKVVPRGTSTNMSRSDKRSRPRRRVWFPLRTTEHCRRRESILRTFQRREGQ